jgi:plasmid stability protein
MGIVEKITIDLDSTTLNALSQRAEQHGHSIDEEVRAIVAGSVAPQSSSEDWIARARSIRAMTPVGSIAVDSWKLIRADRDFGH